MPLKTLSNITVNKVFAANRLLKSPVGITSNRHNRGSWGIVLKKQGKTVYTIKGKQILSDGNHPVILPKGCSYSWKCIEPGECIILEFDTDCPFDDIYCFNISDNSFLVNAFNKIEKNLSLEKPTSLLECKQEIYSVLLFLIKSLQKEYVPKNKSLILKPANDYILANYYNPNITNDFLASLCDISTVYFRKTFESVYGMSPIKYLHTIRINKAKSLLFSDYESIDQVAESVGYNSIYHFSKMFKQYVGISPSKYSKNKSS